MNPEDKLEKKLQEAIASEPEKATDEKVPMDKKLLESIHDSGVVLFHDQYDEPFMSFDGSGSNVCKINSKSGKFWITEHAYTVLDYIVPSEVLNRVQQTLAAEAMFDGLPYPLNVRIVGSKSELWYDLGASAVRITKAGWEVSEQPPIVFKRFKHQEAQVLPTKGGDVRQILKYINVTDPQAQLLLLVYIISAYIPDFPHTLLILHGPQGAGKTTPMMVMKALIDPSAMKNGSSMPKNSEALVQLLSHHAFIFFDNLSRMPEWFSDSLARAATGDSFSKRELYTDDDDVIYHIQKTIALNGINQIVYKSDLLDRAILLNLERISPDKRKEAQVFWSEFEHDRPAILGAVFEVLARALALYPTVKLSKLPRMADFARWGYTIAEAAGFSGQDFIAAYDKNVELQHDEAIAASPLAQTIEVFMEQHDEWKGTVAELYKQLNSIATWKLEISRSKSWPKDTVWFGRMLTPILPNLLAKGIDIDRSHGKERLITIRKNTVDSVVTVADSGKNTPDDDSTTATTVKNRPATDEDAA